MNILSISSILPIPGVHQVNDFVFKISEEYLKAYPNDNIDIFRPINNCYKIISIFHRARHPFNIILKEKGYKYKGTEVQVIPFLSWHRIKFFHVLLAYTIYFTNKKLIKTQIVNKEIDLTHAQLIFPDGLLAYLLKRRYKIPYVITTHNELRYFKNVLSKKIALKVLSHADHILPLNHRNLSAFQSYNLKNTRILPLGYESDIWLDSYDKQKKNTIEILTIAALNRGKNVDKVIEAISTLKDRYKIHYTVFGDGPDKKKLLNLAVSLKVSDIVFLKGQVPNEQLSKELFKYDIFILPSYYETFGRVYFEAMAAGIPIICAKNSGIHGYFKEFVEGLSVDHTNINDISDKLELLINDANFRLSIGQNGKRIVENYTWPKLVSEIHDIYHSSLTAPSN